MKRPNAEYNAGEKDCRDRIIAHVKVRFLKLHPLAEDQQRARGELMAIIRWIQGMPRRAAAKVGGAGRK